MKSKIETGQTVNRRYLFVWDGEGYTCIDSEEIIYVKADANYCHIFTSNRPKHLILSIPMKDLLEDLNPEIFIRIHRSYTINIAYVRRIIGNCLYMGDGSKLTVGRDYRETVKSRFLFIGSRKRNKSAEDAV